VPAAALVVAALLPAPLTAQTVTLLGRVYDAGSDAGVANAIVTLEGRGATLTTEAGFFRLEGVLPGAYTLRVEAFGYRPSEMPLDLETDATVNVPLVAAPIELDGLDVELRTLDFDGRVRDPATGGNLMDAHVLSSQGHDESTDAHGQFDLDDVHEGRPIRVVIRAFGYLQLDTAFMPDDARRHDFDLRPDSLILGMIEVQTRRIEERSAGRFPSYPPPMNRDRLERYLNTFTMLDMLEGIYPQRILRRVACVVIDERHIDEAPGDMRGPLRRSYLSTIFPDEVERVEFLEFSSGSGRPLMLRIYTRQFMAELLTRERPLPAPLMVVIPGGPPLCR
jgi:hypothetical protein